MYEYYSNLENTYEKTMDARTMREFMNAIIKEEYVNVSNIASFLNILWGVHSVKASDINDMLLQLEYVHYTEGSSTQNLKYTPTEQAKGYCKVVFGRGNKYGIVYLQWKIKLIFDLLGIVVDTDGDLEIMFNHMINNFNFLQMSRYKKKENINLLLLRQNLKYFQDEVFKSNNNVHFSLCEDKD